MDGVINKIVIMGLNNVGEVGHEEEKRHILAEIRAVPQDFQFASIDSITFDDIEEFNAAKLEIDREFQVAFESYGTHGALNCGQDYAHYRAIRTTFQDLGARMVEDISYNVTLRFIISPMLALPEENVIRPLDKPKGEKTFSKMCLNLAMKLSLDRFNWVEGFWTKKQLTDFPDLPE